MASTLTKASQVMFKHGTQTSLDTLRSNKTAVTGAFYLTNDTHRLYVGNDSGIPVPVNEGIVSYANLAAAMAALGINGTVEKPELAGQFIYLKDTGILAIFNGKELVQINSDTNTTYVYEDSVTCTKGVVTVTGTLKDNSKEDCGELTFDLGGANGIVVSLASGKITVTGPTLKVISGSGTGKNSTVNIGLQYTDPADGTVKTASSFNIKGSTDVTVSKDGNDVKIEAVDTTLDGNEERNYAVEQGFHVVVGDTKRETSGGDIDPIITLGDNSTEYHFQNGKMNLPVYTKSEIDDIVIDFNAMEYKGVFPPTGSAITQLSGLTNVKNGDTYKAAKNLTVNANGVKADAGDLIIAHGNTENEDGYIDATVVWEVIPSGNEDTQYILNAITGGFELVPNSGGTSGTVEFAGTKKIKMSQTTTESANGDTTKFTFEHETTTRTDTTSTAYDAQSGVAAEYVMKSVTLTTIDAAAEKDGVKTDTYGHVTGTVQKAWTIKDTNAVMDSMTVEAAASDNMATVTLTPALRQSDGTVKEAEGKLYIQSDNANLEVTATGTKVSIDLIWGTF